MQGFRGERGRSSRSRGAEGESKRRRRPTLRAASVDASASEFGWYHGQSVRPEPKGSGRFSSGGIFYHRINALQSRRLLVKTAGEGTVVLSDTEFTEQTSLGTASHPYSAFLSVIRYRGRLFLFVDKRHAYILPDERMTVGDPAGVDAFLEEKCGKPVRVLR